MTAKPTSEGEEPGIAVSNHQITATTSPHLRTSDLVGNFADFEALLDQLGEPLVIRLGEPLPREMFLARRVGSCPAAHNEALIGRRKRRPD